MEGNLSPEYRESFVIFCGFFGLVVFENRFVEEMNTFDSPEITKNRTDLPRIAELLNK